MAAIGDVTQFPLGPIYDSTSTKTLIDIRFLICTPMVQVFRALGRVTFQNDGKAVSIKFDRDKVTVVPESDYGESVRKILEKAQPHFKTTLANMRYENFRGDGQILVELRNKVEGVYINMELPNEVEDSDQNNKMISFAAAIASECKNFFKNMDVNKSELNIFQGKYKITIEAPFIPCFGIIYNRAPESIF